MITLPRKKIYLPYLKEKNILQLPIFYFGMTNLKNMVTKWEDENGEYTLKCFCDYGLPGSFDQDVYAACMRIWVSQGMSDAGIELNYSDIARELRLSPPKNWISKIKKALMRLGLARYEFKHCFLKPDSDGTDIKQFSLFDTANFFEHKKGKSKRNSKSKIYFPKELQENFDKKYYQWLDMHLYRSFPNGLPRRLYEFLEKKRYHHVNGSFVISEENICRWLPVKDKNTTTRRKTLHKIAHHLIDKGYLKYYEFDKTKKLCSYTYADNLPEPEKDIIDVEAKPIQKETSAKTKQQMSDAYDNIHGIAISQAEHIPQASPQKKIPVNIDGDPVKELCGLMKLQRIPSGLKGVVAAYVTEKGVDYVKRNIGYANEHAKKRYTSYLQQSLSKDWGAVWAEEKQMQMDFEDDLEEQIKREEEQRKAEELEKQRQAKELAKQSAVFVEKAMILPSMLKDILRKQALKNIPDCLPKSVIRNQAMIRYGKLVVEALNKDGAGLIPGVIEGDGVLEAIWESD